MHSHFLRAMPIRGSKSVLIAGRSSLYVAKRALCAFLIEQFIVAKIVIPSLIHLARHCFPNFKNYNFLELYAMIMIKK
jgi:hypothetical protein